MPHAITAYIDESGDEGFVFAQLPNRKSSEWWTISAVLTRSSNVAHVEGAVAQYHAEAKKPRPFHFSKERHEHRIGFMNCAIQAPITFVSVITHKPTLLREKPTIATRKHHLFYYTAKLLIERITWFMDYDLGNTGDEKAHIIFSNRGQFRREHLDNYLSILRGQTAYEQALDLGAGSHDIKWRRIQDDLIDVQDHNSLAGLQVADAVASGIRWALEPTPHSLTEHRYAKILAPRVWRRFGRVQSYGLKFEPQLDTDNVGLPHRFHWMRHY